MEVKHLLDIPVGNVELAVGYKSLEFEAKPELELSIWNSSAHRGNLSP